MSPQRIQQRRTPGWRKPAGAIAVGRGTRWGNPYRIGHEAMNHDDAAELYRDYLDANPELVAEVRTHLAGKTLMCWCRPTDRCHADVLLAVANSEGDQ